MRGAPQVTFDLDILRIRLTSSRFSAGRPPARLLRAQNRLNPSRCHPMTVAGWTMARAYRHVFHRRDRTTHRARSQRPKRGRRPPRARVRTPTWCRSARFSNASLRSSERMTWQSQRWSGSSSTRGERYPRQRCGSRSSCGWSSRQAQLEGANVAPHPRRKILVQHRLRVRQVGRAEHRLLTVPGQRVHDIEALPLKSMKVLLDGGSRLPASKPLQSDRAAPPCPANLRDLHRFGFLGTHSDGGPPAWAGRMLLPAQSLDPPRCLDCRQVSGVAGQNVQFLSRLAAFGAVLGGAGVLRDENQDGPHRRLQVHRRPDA